MLSNGESLHLCCTYYDSFVRLQFHHTIIINYLHPTRENLGMRKRDEIEFEEVHCNISDLFSSHDNLLED